MSACEIKIKIGKLWAEYYNQSEAYKMNKILTEISELIEILNLTEDV